MKKILSIIVTLFMALSVFCFESNIMKVDSLNGATLGEYTLLPENWYVDYAGSANSFTARQETKIVAKDGFIFTQLFTGNMDQARINLIPTFNTKFADADMSYGRISNVGEIKSIKIKVWNFGYNNTIYLNFRRSNGELYRCKMGDLDAHKKGPVELVYENSNYIEDPKYKKYDYMPSYPNSASDLYLESVEIHSNLKSPCDGYNFIGIGDIDIIYDQAHLESEVEIDFDEMFNIDSSSSSKEMEKELNKLSDRKAKEDYNRELMDKTEDPPENTEISEK